MNYDAYIIMSLAVWRLIATIRTPILQPIREQLKKYSERGEYLYSAIVWLIAFGIGYAYATMAGQSGGDMLYAMEWSDGYPEIGYAMTATFIASGSAGMRLVEKWLKPKTDVKPAPPIG